MGTTSSIIAWIALGLTAGVVAGILPGKRGAQGFLLNLLLGAGGALAGGFLGRSLGAFQTHDPVGFFWAVVGAMVTLVAYHVAFIRTHRRAY